MKKLFYAAIAAILVLSVGAVGVFAAVSDANGKNYTDADNDGVCDALSAMKTATESATTAPTAE